MYKLRLNIVLHLWFRPQIYKDGKGIRQRGTMTISKDFLIKKIESANKQKDEYNMKDDQNSLIFQGMILAYQDCLTELTKPPEKKKLEKNTIDVNKAFENIIRYYIDKKGYTVEHANEIAMEAIKNQQQKVIQ